MCASSVSTVVPSQGPEKKDFWGDFENIPSDRIGYFVRMIGSHPFITFDTDAFNSSLEEFFGVVGLRAVQARGKNVGGATVASTLVAVLPKLIGPTIALAKLALRWKSERAAQKRRERFPLVQVIILADHIEPVPTFGDNVIDSASTICVLLPELQNHLQTAFPGHRFQVKIRARAARIERVELRVGDIRLSNVNCHKMLKLLDRDLPSLTIMHTPGWFGIPTVASAKWIGPFELPKVGRISGLGRTWGVDSTY